MPFPSSLSHWKQSAWSKSNTFAHAGGLLSCWDFIWVWKVGRWFLSENFSGLSHCFNHANKAAALKLWAETCQLQTAAAWRFHQSTCRAPSISVPISRPSTLNVGSGCGLWPFIREAAAYSPHCHLQTQHPFPLTQLTSFWAGRDHCADGLSTNVQAENRSKCRWKHKV